MITQAQVEQDAINSKKYRDALFFLASVIHDETAKPYVRRAAQRLYNLAKGKADDLAYAIELLAQEDAL